MRLMLLLTSLLALSACGKNDQTNSVQNAGDGLTAEEIVSNDVTAIDAVTGDAANMAADVDMNFATAADNGSDSSTDQPPAKGARTSHANSKKSASPVSNAADNSTAATPVSNSD